MTSRMTIRLQRSPRVSKVRLMGQPERLVSRIFSIHNSHDAHQLHYAICFGNIDTSCNMQVQRYVAANCQLWPTTAGSIDAGALSAPKVSATMSTQSLET